MLRLRTLRRRPPAPWPRLCPSRTARYRRTVETGNGEPTSQSRFTLETGALSRVQSALYFDGFMCALFPTRVWVIRGRAVPESRGHLLTRVPVFISRPPTFSATCERAAFASSATQSPVPMLYFSLALNAVLVVTLVAECRPRANLIVASIALRQQLATLRTNHPRPRLSD
jgi:hypothetical protein